MRRKFLAGFISIIGLGTLIAFNYQIPHPILPMRQYYLTHALLETGSPNVVTAIYLNYRYYDTLFEALMLLISIIAVIFMSVHEEEEVDDE